MTDDTLHAARSILTRRAFVGGLGALFAAPAIIPYANLMPVKVFVAAPSEPLWRWLRPGAHVGEIIAIYNSMQEAVDFVCNGYARHDPIPAQRAAFLVWTGRDWQRAGAMRENNGWLDIDEAYRAVKVPGAPNIRKLETVTSRQSYLARRIASDLSPPLSLASDRDLLVRPPLND